MVLEKLCLKLKRYFWYKMRQCVQYWCNKCDICASKKSPHKRPRAPMKQYIVGAPWERMAIDILGPLPRSEDGNRYLMVVEDYFTKWTEATITARIFFRNNSDHFWGPSFDSFRPRV